ncbi:MAG: glycoside hydrolase family 3 C-terminal domain-containing protein [Salinivirgaceae bacterium]
MKKLVLVLVAGSFSVMTLNSCQQKDKNSARAESLVKQMTLDEKLDFIGGYKDFNIRAIERLAIPEVRFADGPLGVRNYGASTAYPASIGLAASFDKKLAYATGKAVGCESRAKNVHVMLGPAMNIYRAPFCGRNFEYLGEDPYLAGQVASYYSQGMQNEGVMAVAKHYAANNQEFSRHKTSSDMDERTLHEIYLPAFKAAVQQGKVASIMTSYNLVNGVHTSQNDYLINQVLKTDWGFDGYVMSDWVSTYDGLACAKGGLDLEMPSGKFMNSDTLKPAIENGTLSENIIDDKIIRILRTYSRFGLFETPDISKGYVLDSALVRQTALESARGGMVLLKNENGFLPLKKETIKTIAIIGPNGNPAVTGGGGSSKVEPLYPLSLYEAIQKVGGPGIQVSYSKGLITQERLAKDFFEPFTYYSKVDGKKIPGAIADFYANSKLAGNVVTTKTFPELNLSANDLTFEGIPENDFSARFTCYYIPEKTNSYIFGVSGDDGYRMYLDDKLVIDNWQEQAETSRIFESKLTSGKEYKITIEYFQTGGDAVIRFNAVTKSGKAFDPESVKNDALALAKKSDVVILSVGFDQSTESEGFDRTFEMPYNQDALINEVLAVNPNCIVVLNSGGNVNMEPWINGIKGLLHAWYPGQEGNLAAAEILLGITNPSGKLPASFEVKFEDNPTFNSYWDSDKDLKVSYSEGIFVGYRHYDQSEIKPRYPFGYGLSYTNFEYSNLQLAKNTIESGETLTLTVDVKNTGAVSGSEVVQLYVSDLEAALPRPAKELKEFDKILLQPGETKTMTFELNKDAFSYYNPQQHAWVLEPGVFEILVGSSSTDIRQKATFAIQ